MKRTILYAALSLTLFAVDFASADVKLANIFGDHMVVQQDKPVRVFGWADPGEKISVEFNGATARTTAGDDGYFRAELPAVKADGKARTLTVKGKNTVTLSDVLVGEVWICSGQSNMEWPVQRSLNPNEEIAAANHPKIRLFDVPGHTTSPVPKPDVPGKWAVCSPDSVKGFSAVGYYFGRELNSTTDVPVGLIGTNWGGTRIEPWTPLVGFEAVPSMSNEADFVRNLKADSQIKHQQPSAIYNAMVHGLAPFSVRGAIWYQGESNAGDGVHYADKKRALVKGWRSVFENDNLSFYWVQLANFRNADDNPAGGGWGSVREGQRLALDLPHTGMAVIIDIGEAGDIHPKNKQDVGKRLARWALRDHHGKDIVPSGPLFKSMKIEGDKIRITFDHVGGGLMIAEKNGLEPAQPVEGGQLKRFAIAGADKVWHWADAKIDGDTVVVSSDAVKEPVAVRYAYSNNPEGANLYNKQGLPASPFQTDDW